MMSLIIMTAREIAGMAMIQQQQQQYIYIYIYALKFNERYEAIDEARLKYLKERQLKQLDETRLVDESKQTEFSKN